MKRISKYCALCLALIMSVAAIGGCGTKSNPKGESGESGEKVHEHELVDGTCSVCGETPKYDVGNFLVLGDSYSTYKDYIPVANPYYYADFSSVGTDVVSVDQTWWKILEKNTNAKLVLNESYSGSTICNTGFNSLLVEDTSFIGRFDQLVGNGFFEENQIDTVIIFGGTNDSWALSPLGEPMYADWQEWDKYEFFPAFCYLLDRIQKTIPDVKIVCLINTGLSHSIAAGMAKECQHYGVDYVELKDISKTDAHPNIEGMEQIEKQLRPIFEVK